MGGTPSGLVLGTAAADKAGNALTPLEAAIIACEGLTSVEEIGGLAAIEIEKRLRRANLTGLIGDTVAAAASAGLVAAIWGTPNPATIASIPNIVMALLSLVGSCASLYSRYLRRDVSGTDNTLSSVHKKLTEASWEARLLVAKLKLIIQKGANSAATDDGLKMIQRAEELGGEMYRSVRDLGIPLQLARAA